MAREATIRKRMSLRRTIKALSKRPVCPLCQKSLRRRDMVRVAFLNGKQHRVHAEC